MKSIVLYVLLLSACGYSIYCDALSVIDKAEEKRVAYELLIK